MLHIFSVRHPKHLHIYLVFNFSTTRALSSYFMASMTGGGRGNLKKSLSLLILTVVCMSFVLIECYWLECLNSVVNPVTQRMYAMFKLLVHI